MPPYALLLAPRSSLLWFCECLTTGGKVSNNARVVTLEYQLASRIAVSPVGALEPSWMLACRVEQHRSMVDRASVAKELARLVEVGPNQRVPSRPYLRYLAGHCAGLRLIRYERSGNRRVRLIYS